MIIKLNDGTIDTDSASRDELARACIELHKRRLEVAIRDAGLALNAKEPVLEISNLNNAEGWWEEAQERFEERENADDA